MGDAGQEDSFGCLTILRFRRKERFVRTLIATFINSKIIISKNEDPVFFMKPGSYDCQPGPDVLNHEVMQGITKVLEWYKSKPPKPQL
jgi:hypothetical protein